MGKRTMQVVKFVTEDFKSPGRYGQLDYSNFGIPIEIDAASKEKGQCAQGIHVIPINEDTNLGNVLFTGTMILLEVAEEDIVYCEGNGKMRVSKATPVRQVKKSDKEWKIIKTAACKKPEFAYWYAKEVDKKPTDETRKAACKDSICAYWYAKEVDKRPTDETRTAVCQSPRCAYSYAVEIDNGPTDETRTAACKNPEWAYLYARHVDQKPTDETRTAASKSLYWGKQYEQWEKEQCE
jgi:hypothetical protein